MFILFNRYTLVTYCCFDPIICYEICRPVDYTYDWLFRYIHDIYPQLVEFTSEYTRHQTQLGKVKDVLPVEYNMETIVGM